MRTFAPSPAATLAALAPTTPPPRMATLAGSTPGTPPRRMPRPSNGRSRYLAPSWMLMRQRLLDLDDEVGVLPDVRRRRHDLGALPLVLLVRDAAALPGPGL